MGQIRLILTVIQDSINRSWPIEFNTGGMDRVIAMPHCAAFLKH